MQIKAKDFIPLSIDIHHALTVESLPLHHQDPFDRILIAQAIYEHLTIITRAIASLMFMKSILLDVDKRSWSKLINLTFL